MIRIKICFNLSKQNNAHQETCDLSKRNEEKLKFQALSKQAELDQAHEDYKNIRTMYAKLEAKFQTANDQNNLFKRYKYF